MTFQEFKNSMEGNTPPPGLSPLLEALWHEGKGDWNKSHDIAQEIHSKEGSWIHAYLHRKEGDSGNASYWYYRAERPVCKTSLEQEWRDIVAELLKGG
jgi:hypothetical protein